ncbi:MAG: secretin N-terminal domain-containing protein, partial [Rubripirellula sp.]
SLTAQEAAQVEPEVVDSEAAEPTKTAPEEKLQRYTFQHAKAADALEILKQLHDGDLFGWHVALDVRTNSLFYTADDEDAREMEELFAMLDSGTPASIEASEDNSDSLPAIRPNPRTLRFSSGTQLVGSVETLTQQCNDCERQAHQLADTLRNAKAPDESQRNELKLAVRKSFDARQELQRVELAEFARRLQSIQRSIEMREKISQRIIDRRVAELLDPNLKWDLASGIGETPHGFQRSSAESASNVRDQVQGKWIVESMMEGGHDALSKLPVPLALEISGEIMTLGIGKNKKVVELDWEGRFKWVDEENEPYLVDFVFDPNGKAKTLRGILECDGDRLRLCYAIEAEEDSQYRPHRFLTGENVILIECRRMEKKEESASFRREGLFKRIPESDQVSEMRTMSDAATQTLSVRLLGDRKLSIADPSVKNPSPQPFTGDGFSLKLPLDRMGVEKGYHIVNDKFESTDRKGSRSR